MFMLKQNKNLQMIGMIPRKDIFLMNNDNDLEINYLPYNLVTTCQWRVILVLIFLDELFIIYQLQKYT